MCFDLFRFLEVHLQTVQFIVEERIHEDGFSPSTKYEIDATFIVESEDAPGHDLLIEWTVSILDGSECLHTTSDYTRFTFSQELRPTIRKMKSLAGPFGMFMRDTPERGRAQAPLGTTTEPVGQPANSWNPAPAPAAAIVVPAQGSLLSGNENPKFEERDNRLQPDTTAEPVFACTVFGTDGDDGKQVDDCDWLRELELFTSMDSIL